jgi:outer membrane protein OmpA-like peptidoglycan-associated protein
MFSNIDIVKKDILIELPKPKIKKIEKLAISINSLTVPDSGKPLICGDIIEGNIVKTDLMLQDINNNVYGLFNGKINQKDNTWCVQTTQRVPSGEYTVTANGYTVTNSKTQAIGKVAIEQAPIVVSNIKIGINNIEGTTGNKPKVCGTIKLGDIQKATILLKDANGQSFGEYMARIDQESRTWCASVTDELKNGKYKVIAKGYDALENTTIAKNSLYVYVIPGLYNALMKEFQNDFEPWGAELDNDTLTFRFKNPSVLFKVANKELREEFQAILDNFFPRYLKTLLDYKDDIESVIIEGHSSSEHSQGHTQAEKFELNRVFSQGRADEVLSYVTAIPDNVVLDNLIWTVVTFKAEGLSSSRLIYNDNGSENPELSRRVELRIKTNKTNGE